MAKLLNLTSSKMLINILPASIVRINVFTAISAF